MNRAYELAYNFLLAVFPFLLFVVALLGAFAGKGNQLLGYLFSYVQQILPSSAYRVLFNTK